jgi:hypothetical protein
MSIGSPASCAIEHALIVGRRALSPLRAIFWTRLGGNPGPRDQSCHRRRCGSTFVWQCSLDGKRSAHGSMSCSSGRAEAEAGRSSFAASPGSARRLCWRMRRLPPATWRSYRHAGCSRRPSSCSRACWTSAGRCSLTFSSCLGCWRRRCGWRSGSRLGSRPTGSRSGRRRSRFSRRRPNRGRCSSWWTMHTGSTSPQPRRCCSPRGACRPTRSRCCSRSETRRARSWRRWGWTSFSSVG